MNLLFRIKPMIDFQVGGEKIRLSIVDVIVMGSEIVDLRTEVLISLSVNQSLHIAALPKTY